MTMTQERLRNLIDAYGADPTRWPEPERDAAAALLAASPDARALLAEAASLDRLLDRYANPAEGALNPLQLAARITATAGGPTAAPLPAPANRNRIVLRWHGMTALAAAGIAGFMIGWTGIDRSMLPASAQVQPIEQALRLLESAEDLSW